MLREELVKFCLFGEIHLEAGRKGVIVRVLEPIIPGKVRILSAIQCINISISLTSHSIFIEEASHSNHAIIPLDVHQHEILHTFFHLGLDDAVDIRLSTNQLAVIYLNESLILSECPVNAMNEVFFPLKSIASDGLIWKRDTIHNACSVCFP